MRHRYPPPGNEDEFEEFCLRFYRHLLKNEGLVRYAKRGLAQDGIDIFDQYGIKPHIAIQCKCHEQNKTISPKKIEDEVEKAESSSHPIDKYIIATTAKKSKNAQDTVLNLNLSKNESRHFTVEIHFWEDICSHLNEFGSAVAVRIVYCEQDTDQMLMPAQFSTSSYGVNDTDEGAEDSNLFPDIDVLFKERKLEVVEYEIGKLPDPEQVRWSRFSDRKVPLNKVELDLVNQGILMLSA